MASRRNLPPEYDERFRGMLPHGPPAPDPFDNKIASQAAEIDRLARDNHKLATSHLALRQDLVAAQRDAEKLKEHIRSLRTEGDIQIRILLDKISKVETDIRDGDNLKKEVQEAHVEARSLVTCNVELTSQIQKATLELDNARGDVKKLPDLHVELDNLRDEHQRIRETFEHEKDMNVEKVKQMKILEKDLIAMTEEVEKLRAELSNAEKRAHAPAPIPYAGPCVDSTNLHPPLFYGNGVYGESFGGPHLHMVGGHVPVMEEMNLYSGGGYAFAPSLVNGPVFTGGEFAGGPPVINGPIVGGGGGNHPVWGGAYEYDASNIQR